MNKLYNNILETIGDTPIVKLNKLGPDDVNVYVNKTNADPYEIGRELLWTMKVAG